MDGSGVVAWEEGKGESWTWSERDESSLMSSGDTDTIQQHSDSNRIGQPRNEETMPVAGVKSQKRGVVLAKRAAPIDGD